MSIYLFFSLRFSKKGMLHPLFRTSYTASVLEITTSQETPKVYHLASRIFHEAPSDHTHFYQLGICLVFSSSCRLWIVRNWRSLYTELHAAGFGMRFVILVHQLLQRRITRQVRVLQQFIKKIKIKN